MSVKLTQDDYYHIIHAASPDWKPWPLSHMIAEVEKRMESGMSRDAAIEASVKYLKAANILGPVEF